MEKLHAWAGPSGVMKLVLGQECMHQKRVLCNCRMWPPWGLKIVTNPSSIFINKSWSPWTAGQEKEISTRLRVFLWRTSSSTRTTKWAVDKAINHSTHIHLPFSRSWLIMQKVDLLKAWPEMVWFSRIFFQDCSMMMILIPGKAWQFVLFSLFLVLTVRILLTSSWPGQFWNFVFSLRWREESLLEFPKWAFRLSTLLCWGLGLKKSMAVWHGTGPVRVMTPPRVLLTRGNQRSQWKGEGVACRDGKLKFFCQRFAWFVLRFPLWDPL